VQLTRSVPAADRLLQFVVHGDLHRSKTKSQVGSKEKDNKVINQVWHVLPGVWDYAVGQLEIGPIEWWLEWLVDESNTDSGYWLQDRISWLFSSCLSKETRQSFVDEFNKPRSKYRMVLAHSLLLRQNDLTTDDFSADAVSFLLADLDRSTSDNSFHGLLLGRTATEQFVDDRLLPLIPEAKGPLLSNLQEVLRQAGSRHGRRYILE